MKLAASNIAWAPVDRARAYRLLQAHGATGLEIAPGLFFNGASDPLDPTVSEAAPAMWEVQSAGLQIVSMQSLLFGVEGAHLFGTEHGRERFLQGMTRAISLAGRFGIPNLVFGAPRERNMPPQMTLADAEKMALAVFRRLGDLAAKARTKLGVEFCPPRYGTNFLTTLESAEDFVRRVDHPHVTLILDLGAMRINEAFSRIEAIILRASDVISHVHFSEPDLAPAPADVQDAEMVCSALDAAGYGGWRSIEMKAQPDDLASLERCLERLSEAALRAQRSSA